MLYDFLLLSYENQMQTQEPQTKIVNHTVFFLAQIMI